MSFDVNSIGNKPVIREAASMNNDGGGGNLGYFEGGEGKKDHKSNESIFASEQEEDTFKKENTPETLVFEFSLSNIIAKVILFFKDLLKNFTKQA